MHMLGKHFFSVTLHLWCNDTFLHVCRFQGLFTSDAPETCITMGYIHVCCPKLIDVWKDPDQVSWLEKHKLGTKIVNVIFFQSTTMHLCGILLLLYIFFFLWLGMKNVTKCVMVQLGQMVNNKTNCALGLCYKAFSLFCLLKITLYHCLRWPRISGLYILVNSFSITFSWKMFSGK